MYLHNGTLRCATEERRLSAETRLYVDTNKSAIISLINTHPNRYYCPMDEAAGRHSLSRIRVGNGNHVLVCMPPISGTPWCYRLLLPGLLEETSVIGVYARGYGTTWDCPSSIEEIAEHALQDVVEAVSEFKRVHICGYSMGGFLGIELARRLPRAGVDVGTLILIDSNISSGDRQTTPELTAQPAWLIELFMDVHLGWGISSNISRDPEFRGKPLLKQLEHILATGHRHRALADSIDCAGIMRMFEMQVRLQMAFQNYRPELCEFHASYIAAENSSTTSSALDWLKFFRSAAAERIPGSHLSLIFDEINALRVAKLIETIIRRN